MRRPLSILLMLFLLLSQQATLSHAVSHWAPAVLAASSGDPVASDGSDGAAHACELCLAAAQYAAALPTSPLHLQAVAAPALHDAFPAVRGFQAGPALAFRSRAPPSA